MLFFVKVVCNPAIVFLDLLLGFLGELLGWRNLMIAGVGLLGLLRGNLLRTLVSELLGLGDCSSQNLVMLELVEIRHSNLVSILKVRTTH